MKMLTDTHMTRQTCAQPDRRQFRKQPSPEGVLQPWFKINQLKHL